MNKVYHEVRQHMQGIAGILPRSSKKAGLSPGTLIYTGDKKAEKVTIRVIDYSPTHYEARDAQVEDIASSYDSGTVTWIDICGLHDIEIIEKIGLIFGLHSLVMEDIVNTGHRPKLEDHGDHLFLVMKMLKTVSGLDDVEMSQVSIVLGTGYIITFQEREGHVFDNIRERLQKKSGRIRNNGPDYLMYAFIDAVVDNYFVVLEGLGDVIETVESELAGVPTMSTLQSIRRLKSSMIFLRKTIWPLREMIGHLQRGESTLINAGTIIYIRDVYDHTIQVIDTIESIRDMLSGMLDIYLSSVSNRMNEVMKVLTIFASIFIPLTFIAGVYGMNFANMPELDWGWGYFGILGVMALLGIGLLIYFKRKKWF